MFTSISDYLQKFENITPPEKMVKQAVVTCLYSKLNVEVNPENISYKQGIVYIKTHPAVKSEIKMDKEIILKRIREDVGGKERIKDIR